MAANLRVELVQTKLPVKQQIQELLSGETWSDDKNQENPNKCKSAKAIILREVTSLLSEGDSKPDQLKASVEKGR